MSCRKMIPQASKPRRLFSGLLVVLYLGIHNVCWHSQCMLSFTVYVGIRSVCWHSQCCHNSSNQLEKHHFCLKTQKPEHFLEIKLLKIFSLVETLGVSIASSLACFLD